jgi:Holliday junction resolvase RusA-like endonuclease
VHIEFTVSGTPQALKRHRTFRRGSLNIEVDPSAAAKQSFLMQALEHRPKEPLREALSVTMQFRFPRPKAHFRAKSLQLRPDAPHWHTSRPDVDNLTKFVMDALNGIFWHDDSCLARLEVTKQYGETPGVLVTILSA